MGMNLYRETNKILSSLVFSLAQIDSFRRHFYENNFSGELSKIFSDIVQKNCLNKMAIPPEPPNIKSVLTKKTL